MIEINQTASETIKSYLADSDADSPVRIYVQSGCGGASLVMGPDETKDNDQEFEVDGLTYIVDKFLLERTGAISVQWVDDGIRKGLTVSSENTLQEMEGCPGGCSC